MARVASMAVVYFLALVLTTKAAAAIDCMSAASSIMPCSNFLRDPKPTAPGSSCCNAAGNLLRLGDAASLCECLAPFTSGFLQSKAQQLSALCNLDAFSSIAGCIAKSSDKPESFLPPVGPITSFPFPPVGPITSIPFPPLGPITSLPPFIPLPPFTLTPFNPLPPFTLTPFNPLPPFNPAPPTA